MRSLLKNTRLYVDGFDLSGHSRSVGPLAWTFAEGEDAPMSASVKGVWPGQASVSAGTINAMLDNTLVTGIHTRLSSLAGSVAPRQLIAALGMDAAPVANVPTFSGQFSQQDYQSTPTTDPVMLTIVLAASRAAASGANADNPWGVLLHANSAVTGANTATGLDQLASTTRGGSMHYQILDAAGAGNCTATIKVQDAGTNADGSFADLLSTGVINCGSGGVAVPTAGTVALVPTATVQRYVRWQVTLGTATSVTLVLAFNRKYN